MKQQCFEDICGCTVDSCPITYSMKMIGGKWRPIIIMRIAQNINRFGVLHRGIDGISKNMLTRELRDLEKNNIISRKIYAEIPPRVEYSLTKKGKSLVPVLDKLNDWSCNAWSKLYEVFCCWKCFDIKRYNVSFHIIFISLDFSY